MKNFNWKKILQWLTIIIAAIGGNQAVDYATAEDQAPTEYASPAASASLPYEIAVAFAIPDGGGAFPAFQDDAGPVLLRVEKPSQDRIKAAFNLDYGELYPNAVVTGFMVVSGPDKEAELEPDEPVDE